MSVVHISSRDNAHFKALRKLAQDNQAYRKQGQVWLEGDHLCRAAQTRGLSAATLVFQHSFWLEIQCSHTFQATKTIVIDDPLWAALSSLESPARMAMVLDLPSDKAILADAPTVVLDRLQDAGNVGSILRSAAAFGFRQVLALHGTAGLWSPKVVRAGMGAHFGLHLVESVQPEQLSALGLPLLVTSSHQGHYLHQAELPWPCAWVLGHEGQGVAPQLVAMATQAVRIAQPGGEESLNVAAAAAICLHASASARVA